MKPIVEISYKLEHLAQMQEKGRWVFVVDDVVYDVTEWALRNGHPGGRLVLQHVAGTDATATFTAFHNGDANVRRRLHAFRIGRISSTHSGSPDRALQEDFVRMVQQLESCGQFQLQPRWYAAHVAVLCLLLCTVVCMCASSVSSTGTSVAAIGLGILWQQLAFLGHDLGHRSARSRLARMSGWCVTAAFGVSLHWWKHNHNVHHIATNHVEHDPDIQHQPVLAVSAACFPRYFSSYYERYFDIAADTVARWCVARQHLLYYPIMAVARWNLYLQSILHLMNPQRPLSLALRCVELTSLLVYWSWLVGLTLLLPSHAHRLWFLILSHVVAGIVHVQITLSHFAQPVTTGLPGFKFVQTQFDTSMDISCPPYLDWFHGGLQFQVTHHLLPRIPRHRLRYVTEHYVLPFARRHGLTYKSESFVQANRSVLRSLHEVARACACRPWVKTLAHSPVIHALQLHG